MIAKTLNLEIEEINKDGINITSKPVSSIELTPGTDYMERIHEKIILYLKELKEKNLKCIYSSYHEAGEGEHKIFNYFNEIIRDDKSIIINGKQFKLPYSYDSRWTESINKIPRFTNK